MSALIMFIHVLFGVSFFGMLVASFVTISSSIRQKNPAFMHQTIKASLIHDYILFPVIVGVIITGAFMTKIRDIAPGTAWITDTYVLFFIASVIWFCLVLIKLKNLSEKKFVYKKLFYVLNVTVMLLFFLIIHDVTTKQTWF
ncbi:MAG: DUF2269 family protein [Coxiellaceae bacterium]|nr:DUF2269 family protein [Coxiellaceae bacterium]